MLLPFLLHSFIINIVDSAAGNFIHIGTVYLIIFAVRLNLSRFIYKVQAVFYLKDFKIRAVFGLYQPSLIVKIAVLGAI